MTFWSGRVGRVLTTLVLYLGVVRLTRTVTGTDRRGGGVRVERPDKTELLGS